MRFLKALLDSYEHVKVADIKINDKVTVYWLLPYTGRSSFIPAGEQFAKVIKHDRKSNPLIKLLATQTHTYPQIYYII